MVRFLLGNGAQTRIAGPRVQSAICMAVFSGKKDDLELLLSHCDKPTPLGCNDPFHMAASKGYLEIVELLLDHGFDVNARSW